MQAYRNLRTRLDTRIHLTYMGNEQSSIDLTECDKPVDGDVEASNGDMAANEVKSEIYAESIRFEASTQTYPVEEGGYDMRVPRRKRNLFGVVNVVGVGGGSSVLPSADEHHQSYCLLALVGYLRRLVCRVCGCSWLSR